MLRFILASLIAATCTLTPPREKDEQAEASDGRTASQPAFPRNPTQARIFEELLRDTERGNVKPILSERGIGRAAIATSEDGSPSLLLEGTILIERLGRLASHGNRSEFHFTSGSPIEDAPDVMEFNKNGLLEAMEEEAEAGVKEFIISAEVTRYRNQNYLNLLKYRRQISHGNLTP